jgi:23S rRNA pseudouridine2605 synthase
LHCIPDQLLLFGHFMSRERKPFNTDKNVKAGAKKTGDPGKRVSKPAFKREEKGEQNDDRPAKFTKRGEKSGSGRSSENKPDKPYQSRAQKEYGDSKESRPSRFKEKPEKIRADKPKKNTSRSGRTLDETKADPKASKGKFGQRDFREKRAVGDPVPSFSEDVRLNKYISNAGVCSRREADVMIASGVVKVNGKIITELGYKVKPGDEVKYDGETIRAEKKQYVLLNKPKDFITTLDDPMNRKTVMQLVVKACKERIYPVGRLDRNTTGVLLFTNDGDLAKKLTHPRYEVKKLYHVETAEPVTKEQIAALLSGVELEDGGFVKADKAEIIKDSRFREVGIEIHSGKYRVVRRMFESLGHTIKKLDRVAFAGLTKKDLPRGNYRHLTEQEVAFLRML